MSQNAKIAIAVVAVLVLAAAGYYWYHRTQPKDADDVFMNASTTLPSGTSTTDDSLNKDTAAIDAQLQGLSSDQATVNSSVNESAQ